MAKGNKKLALAIIAVILIIGVSVGAWYILRQWGYQPPGNFQVKVEGTLRADLGANAPVASHEVDVYRDGGATYVETVTSATTTGKLEFANMYWVGETITLQVRTDAYGSITHGSPYIMSPVNIVVPGSAQPGDTVKIGSVWCRLASDAITPLAFDHAGAAVTNTDGYFLNTSDTALVVRLSSCDSTEGWGAEDEVTDLRTGYVFVGAIVVLKTSYSQPVSNAKWHVSTGQYQYYVLQIGRFADDPNIPDDGNAECMFSFDAALTADTTCIIDAYDVQKWDDMQAGVFGTHQLDNVGAITTKIA